MIFYIPFGLDIGAILYCVSIFFEPFFSDFLDSDFLDSDFLAIFEVSFLFCIPHTQFLAKESVGIFIQILFYIFQLSVLKSLLVYLALHIYLPLENS